MCEKNIKKMNSYEVLRLYRDGIDFMCPYCKLRLVSIPENISDRRNALGLHCPKNDSHFFIITKK